MVAWQVPRVRILKIMKAYRSVPEDSPPYLPTLAIPDGQKILGIYENVPNATADCVVVTDKALWVENNGQLLELRFDEMAAVTWAPENKREANSLEIRMQDGAVRHVPVRGRQDGGADLFEFDRFVLRSIADFRLLRAEQSMKQQEGSSND